MSSQYESQHFISSRIISFFNFSYLFFPRLIVFYVAEILNLACIMQCKNDEFKARYAKHATMTPDNVKTRIQGKKTYAGIKRWNKNVFKSF